MKDHRFIELVNLYIDRQITAEETAELEGEIQNSPRRRAVYRQYCQMHRATKQIYDSFRNQASGEETGATPARPGPVLRLAATRPRRHRAIYYAGGIAAAACLALVLARMGGPGVTAAGLMVQLDNPASTPELAATAEAPAPTVATVTPVKIRLVPVGLQAIAEPDYAAQLLTMRRAERQALANGDIQPSRLPSLFDDGVFDSQPTLLPQNEQRVYRSHQVPGQGAEFTAFEFQH